MLLKLTRGWYLRCYKYRRRYVSIYLNMYSRESSFPFRVNSSIQFNHKKTNQQSKIVILMKPTKHLAIIASSLWNRY